MKNKKCAQKGGCHSKLKFLELYFIWRLSKSPSHGYSLAEDVRASFPMKQMKMSTVYSVLSKLEGDGLIKGIAKESGGRIRRLYRTTAKGKKLFAGVRGKKFSGPIREFMLELLGVKK